VLSLKVAIGRYSVGHEAVRIIAGDALVSTAVPTLFSADGVRAYHEQGFAIVREVFSAEEMALLSGCCSGRN
jgi:hypothetical protein